MDCGISGIPCITKLAEGCIISLLCENKAGVKKIIANPAPKDFNFDIRQFEYEFMPFDVNKLA
jgi:hypothetical protein